MKKYIEKDIKKFSICNKLISRGTSGSSSDLYTKGMYLNIPKENINCRDYNKNDIVGISVNGNRPNRISFDKELVDLAIKAGSTIVIDNQKNRLRQYNVGEREIEKYLIKNNYECVEDDEVRSIWRRKMFKNFKIRIVNKRKDPTYSWTVYCGRGSPVGNPYKMKNYSEEERMRVIKLFEENFDFEDPKVQEYLDKIIKIGQKYGVVDLQCYCSPKKCHCEIIRDKILKIRAN